MLLFDQFRSPLVLILFFAAGVAAFVRDWLDAAIIRSRLGITRSDCNFAASRLHGVAAHGSGALAGAAGFEINDNVGRLQLSCRN